MPLGHAVEEPITSYFRRVNTTRSHKQNQIIRSTAKRKRTQTSQAEESEQPKTRQKLTLTDASRNRNGASQPKKRLSAHGKGSSAIGQPASHASQLPSTSPLMRDQLLSRPPDIGSVGKGVPASIDIQSSFTTCQSIGGSFNRQNNGGEDGRNRCNSLQTPPPTTRPSKSCPAPTGCTRPILLPAALRHSSEMVSLPTPAMIPRRIPSGHGSREPALLDFAPVRVPALPSPSNSIDSHSAQFHNPMSTGGSRKSGVSGQLKRGPEQNLDGDPFVGPSASEMVVLSSQSQHVDLLPPHIQPLQELTESPLSSIFSHPVPRCSLSRGISSIGASNDDDFIHSSQTQHVLPRHISPRRKCANEDRLDTRHLSVDESTCEEVVASSQSQTENELDLSMRILDRPYEQLMIRAGLSETFSGQNRSPSPDPPSPPYRTLSDELSVPIQTMTFFNKDLLDTRNLAPVDPNDSATETEDESENGSCNRYIDVTGDTRNCALAPTIDGVGAGGETLQETAEYTNSLPSTVQDFEVMFDE